MEKQWHARRQNNPGRQKNPAAKKPDFDCTILLTEYFVHVTTTKKGSAVHFYQIFKLCGFVPHCN